MYISINTLLKARQTIKS